MGLGDGMTDRQAHAQAFLLGGKEGIEQAPGGRGVQPDPGVFHRDENFSGVAPGADAQEARAIRDAAHGIEAVDDQIREQLLDLHAVDGDRGKTVGQDALHPDAAPLDIGIEKREEFVDDGIDAGGLKYIESRCLTYIGPRCIVRP